MSAPPLHAAERLQFALAGCGISTDINHDHDVAVVSVWADLLVLTDGFVYRWWTGQLSSRTGRRLYAICDASDSAFAARCVVQRYEELRKSHPYRHPMPMLAAPM
ncbi:hypothetical protein [Streptosporangium subroseum]|uniref:hypothetical protein n=1 Tax=Streptosporangium subroseum TaxID=106412 RepID=UPI0030853B65|nr:hypothetical protein OHB15_45855 [Streptosporangium subroseum]